VIPLWARENVTDSELVAEDFRECAACKAKPGSPSLCPSCLQNRALISRLQGVVRRSPLHQVKNAIRGHLFNLWNWDKLK
jgi:hypothetical protein